MVYVVLSLAEMRGIFFVKMKLRRWRTGDILWQNGNTNIENMKE